MLCLSRKSAEIVALYQALLRRGILTVEQKQWIKDRLSKMLIGLDGEQRADRFWEDLQLQQKYLLFHNFETTNRLGFSHQMDTVFICSKFVLILELKHIAGEILYDSNSNQLLRTYNGEVQAMGDPFNQVTRHVEWFEHFLWNMGVKDLPIMSAVVMTRTSAVLKNMPPQFHVFKLEGLRFKLKEWLVRHQDVIDPIVLEHLGEQVIQQLKRSKPKIPFDNLTIRTGALCPVCQLKMNYLNGIFTCACGIRCRDGFQRGLADYRLLKGEWITNRSFREFFELESTSNVSHLLKRLNLKSEGVRKSRRYLIPEDITSHKLYKRKKISVESFEVSNKIT